MPVSLRDRLLGFAGFGGMAWYFSIFRGGGSQPEDLEPAAVEAPGMKTVDLLGERVAYLDEGQGDPPLVFIHGFGESTRTWDLVRPAFTANHRTLALDLWGFGASGRPARARQEQWVDQVTGLLDHLSIPRAILVGHSLGGRVSLLCANRVPERVQALVLCDADWGQSPLGYVFLRLVAHTELLALSLGRLRANDRALRDLMNWVGGPTGWVKDQQLALYQRYLRVQGTRRCWTSLAQHQRPSQVRHLPEGVQCPALVIWGQEEAVIPLGLGEELAQRLTGADLVTVPQSGHFPQEEQPEAVITALQEFLGSLSRSTEG